jgi:CubicO group peptidase (beta-lactamase class C family)/D-alanyl-D-alanine dipeptidase
VVNHSHAASALQTSALHACAHRLRWLLVRHARPVRAFCLGVFVASPVFAQSPDLLGPLARYSAVAETLSRFIEHEMAVHRIPALSIALVDSSGVVWSRGFGVENPATRRPASANTVYRVGSVSKLFTDIGIMQLVERGRLNLDAPVQRYLPTFRPRNSFGTPITLRQLMSHHAGVVREPPVGHYFDDTAPSLAATVASLNGTSLVHAPGSKMKYSNAAIAVVGRAFEQQMRAPFASALGRSVLEPMGMTSSSFSPLPALTARLAQGEMWTYIGRTFPAPRFELGMAPAGSMYSTMPDLGRFLTMLFDGGAGERGRVLRRATLDQMLRPQFAAPNATDGAGLGFMVSSLDGARLIGHGGAIYGFATQLSALPAERLGVAVSAAKDGANALTSRIATEALRLMRASVAGRPLPPIRVSSPISLALAQSFAGSYARDGVRIDVTSQDSSVTVSSARLDFALQMRQWSGDTLVADNALAFMPTMWRTGDTLSLGGRQFLRQPAGDSVPGNIPERWRGLIGEYGWDHNVLYVLEREGKLSALIEWFFEYPLTQISDSVFAFPNRGLYSDEQIIFRRDASGRAREAVAAGVRFKRRDVAGAEDGIFRITPQRPVADLQRDALAAQPPVESGTFRSPELTELTSLDSTIRLDIRYASDRNFMSTPFYSQPRAFLQRPAAEALVRAHRRLAAQGFGLLIHDGYRPWYVTKMFWDATPQAQRNFVADPSRGSRHNRGCAVDLTMYDLRTGTPIISTGGYDEMSDRSYAFYPGGTSRQRALRDMLRHAMEAEGFTVYSDEWWHFDYKDFPLYRISNLRFEEIAALK